jgi:hypothetical protein
MNPKYKIMAGALAVIVVCILTACASVQQAVDLYGGIAVSNVKAANDSLVEGYKVGICALPLSAITRHPEIIPAVRSLCIAPGDKVAGELLDAIEAKP